MFSMKRNIIWTAVVAVALSAVSIPLAFSYPNIATVTALAALTSAILATRE